MNLIDKLNRDTIIFPLSSVDKSDAVQVLLNQLLNQKILTATTIKFINEVCMYRETRKILKKRSIKR